MKSFFYHINYPSPSHDLCTSDPWTSEVGAFGSACDSSFPWTAVLRMILGMYAMWGNHLEKQYYGFHNNCIIAVYNWSCNSYTPVINITWGESLSKVVSKRNLSKRTHFSFNMVWPRGTATHQPVLWLSFRFSLSKNPKLNKHSQLLRSSSRQHPHKVSYGVIFNCLLSNKRP